MMCAFEIKRTGCEIAPIQTSDPEAVELQCSLTVEEAPAFS